MRLIIRLYSSAFTSLCNVLCTFKIQSNYKYLLWFRLNFIFVVQKREKPSTSLLFVVYWYEHIHLLIYSYLCGFTGKSYSEADHGKKGIQQDQETIGKNTKRTIRLARNVTQDDSQLWARLALDSRSYRKAAVLPAHQTARAKSRAHSLLGTKGMPGKRGLPGLGISERPSLLVSMRHPVWVHQWIII